MFIDFYSQHTTIISEPNLIVCFKSVFFARGWRGREREILVSLRSVTGLVPPTKINTLVLTKLELSKK